MTYSINKDFKFKKSFGQNFLIDNNIKTKFTDKSDIENRVCIEIGPGDGSITLEILKRNPKMLFCIEKDQELYKTLLEKFKDHKNLTIINEDALKFDYNKIFSQYNEKINFIGGLPYNVGTDIVVNLLQYYKNIEECCFILQKEVAKKFCTKPSEKDFNFYGAVLKCFADSQYLFDISNNCFFPRPNVTSGAFIIKIKEKKIMDHFYTYEEVLDFLTIAFKYRKKNLSYIKKLLYDKPYMSSFKSDEEIKTHQFLTKIFKNLT